MGSVNDFIAFTFLQYSQQLKEDWLKVSPISTPGPSLESDVIKVNNFLRIQLGLLEMDTTKARECLIMEPSFDAWARNFREVVAPVIAKHGLPVWRN